MARSLVIEGGDVLLPDGSLVRQSVVVRDGLISDQADESGAERLDAGGLIVAPGLIDIQLNGGFGHDFTAEATSIWSVGARLPAYGVTGFVPTVVTAPIEARSAILTALKAGPPPGYLGAAPLGAHFEGPFISPRASGAHDPAYLRPPTDVESGAAGWSRAAGVLLVTLAPELDGAPELARELVARGVAVSAGHSAASYDEALTGFDAGITCVTHLFNAMPPLLHREPGLTGAAMADERVTVGIIPDGGHVHPAVVRIAAAAAGEARTLIVTDATAALGMPPGRYELAGRNVELADGAVRLVDGGGLAGSAIPADQALRRFALMTGRAVPATLAAMTSVPARLLSLTDRGAIRVGARADLTLFDHDLRVVATFIGGERWAS